MERNGWGPVAFDNKNVDPAENISDLTDQTDNLGFATYVRLECVGRAVVLPNALAELVSRIAAIEVVDGNIRTDRSLLESDGGS
jgi:hypothetical protein